MLGIRIALESTIQRIQQPIHTETDVCPKSSDGLSEADTVHERGGRSIREDESVRRLIDGVAKTDGQC